MALPQLAVKNFEVRQPSTGSKLTLRPFLVAEEKILLQAGENMEDMLPAMKQVLGNCIQGEKIDLDQLPAFDIEFIFLRLRSESVGANITLGITHKEGCESTEVEINLREIKCVVNEDISNEIMLDKKVGVRLKYPTLSMMDEFAQLDEDQLQESSFTMIRSCIESIYTTDGETHDAQSVPKEELDAFVNSMNTEQFMSLQKFFEEMPTVRHVVKVPKCVTCGMPFERELRGINSFF